MNFQNILTIIKNLTSKLKAANNQPPPSAQPSASTGTGQAQPSPAPKKQQVNSYHLRPIENGKVATRVEEISNNGGTVSVNIAEIHVPTANGTIVDVKDIALICGVCGGISEERWYCHQCSVPLCVPHLLCVKLPDTNEVLHMCPECCSTFYAQWNTWRGKLKAPFSIRKGLQNPGEKS